MFLDLREYCWINWCGNQDESVWRECLVLCDERFDGLKQTLVHVRFATRYVTYFSNSMTSNLRVQLKQKLHSLFRAEFA